MCDTRVYFRWNMGMCIHSWPVVIYLHLVDGRGIVRDVGAHNDISVSILVSTLSPKCWHTKHQTLSSQFCSQLKCADTHIQIYIHTCKQICTNTQTLHEFLGVLKAVLHLLNHNFVVYLNRCSTDLRLLLGHSVTYLSSKLISWYDKGTLSAQMKDKDPAIVGSESLSNFPLDPESESLLDLDSY